MTFSCPDRAGGSCLIPTGDDFLRIQSVDSDGGIGTALLVLFGTLAVIRIAGAAAMVFAVSRQRRM